MYQGSDQKADTFKMQNANSCRESYDLFRISGVRKPTDLWKDISCWLMWWLKKPRISTPHQTTLDAYYKSYKNNFSQYIKECYAKQTEEVSQLIWKKRGACVLEIGCGCGTESLWFGLLGASVIGTDIRQDRIEVAEERLKYIRKNFPFRMDVQFKKSNFFEIDDVPMFDIIWMEQAFHHIEPRKSLPYKLSKILNPGGYVVISEANGWNPLLQAMLIYRRGFCNIKLFSDENGQTHIYGNERITTPGRIRRLFSKTEFKMKAIKYFRVLPNFKSVEKFAWIDQLIPHSMIPLFTHYNVIIQKSNH